MSPTKTKESWRDLLTQKELAAYDAGKPLPRESLRVSHHNKTVSYNPEALAHQPEGQNGDGTFRRAKANVSDGNTDSEQRVALPPTLPDPELRKFYQLALEGLDAYATLPASCVDCGRHLPGDIKDSRTTILIHDGPDNDRCRVFCGDCWNAIRLKFDEPDGSVWGTLDARSLEIWELAAEGLSQEQIADRLQISQPTVSRVIVSVREALRTARQEKSAGVNKNE